MILRPRVSVRVAELVVPMARVALGFSLVAAGCATGDDLGGRTGGSEVTTGSGTAAGDTAGTSGPTGGGTTANGGASSGTAAGGASSTGTNAGSSAASTGISTTTTAGASGTATGSSNGSSGTTGSATTSATGSTSGGSSTSTSGGTTSTTTGGATGSTGTTGRTTTTTTGGATGSTGIGVGCGSSSDTPGTLFFDDFEDGEFMMRPRIWSMVNLSSSSGSPGTWSVISDPTVSSAPSSGDAGASGSKVLAQTAASGDWLVAVSGDYRCADQAVSAKFKLTTSGSSLGTVGVFARYVDTRNYYFLYIDGGSKVHLRGKVDGSTTDAASSVSLKSPLPPAITGGTWHTMKIAVVGQTMNGYLDDQLVISGPAPSPGLASGGIAVGTESSATAEFDDVTVTAP